jgi:sugar/nucleoside kinase (ribokinase family)
MARTRADLVVLGLGTEGNLAWQRGDRDPVHTAAAPLPAGTDTTGAGDTLLAAVVSYALEGDRPLAAAMRLATDATSAALARRHRSEQSVGAQPVLDG